MASEDLEAFADLLTAAKSSMRCRSSSDDVKLATALDGPEY